MSTILSDIRQSGYALIRDALPDVSTFAETYRALDAVAQLVAADELAQIFLERITADWSKDPRRSSYFARAPMGFRNRSLRADKEKKSYFQYAPAFGTFVREQYARSLSVYPELDWLFEKCELLCETSTNVLKSVIFECDNHYQGIRRLLDRENGAPVIVRLIRYEPGTHIESAPHYDKSAFTIHMHSDDKNADQFVIGPWSQSNLRLSDLSPITSRADSMRMADAVVFPGLFLSQMGYSEILPSPHAALGSDEPRHRHVAVGFWLVPYIYTDHLTTNIPLRDAA